MPPPALPPEQGTKHWHDYATCLSCPWFKKIPYIWLASDKKIKRLNNIALSIMNGTPIFLSVLIVGSCFCSGHVWVILCSMATGLMQQGCRMSPVMDIPTKPQNNNSHSVMVLPDLPVRPIWFFRLLIYLISFVLHVRVSPCSANYWFHLSFYLAGI